MRTRALAALCAALSLLGTACRDVSAPRSADGTTGAPLLDRLLHRSLVVTATHEVATIDGEAYVMSDIAFRNRSDAEMRFETAARPFLVSIYADPRRDGEPLYAEHHHRQVNDGGFRQVRCAAGATCRFIEGIRLADLAALVPGVTYHVFVAFDVEHPARATTPFAAGTLRLP